MGRLSDDVMDDFLGAYFGTGLLNVPSTYYIGLSQTQPTNTGTSETPPLGDGYARATYANGAAAWNGTGRTRTNANPITFPTATGNWGDLGFFTIWRSLTGTAPTDFIGWGQLDTPATVVGGGTLDFPPNALTIDAPGT